MHGQNVLDRLEFQEDGVVDDALGAVALGEMHVLVNHRRWHFAAELKVGVLELVDGHGWYW